MCNNHEHHNPANHAGSAEALIAGMGQPQGNTETLALAQVHATLALAQVNASVGQIVGAGVNELNTANLFKLAASTDPNNPLRNMILSGLLHNLMGDEAAHPEILLADHLKASGLNVQGGDDITLSNDQESHNLLVVDPDGDDWLLFNDEGNESVNSPGIFTLFGANISTLVATMKESPAS